MTDTPTPQDDALQLARRVADAFLAAQQSPWGSYTIDLTLEALLALDDASGRPEYRSHVLDLVHRRAWGPDKQPPPGVPPFTCLIFEVCRVSGDERYVPPFIRGCEDYRRTIPRDEAGIVLHPRREGGHAMLIDSLQEYATRMARGGLLSGREEFFTECVRQFALHRDVLRRTTDGLYAQGRGWLEDPASVSPHAWSRGQGWLLRGMVDSLRCFPESQAGLPELRDMTRELADALLAVQDPGGMWHALVDLSPARSPAESSGTGLIAYALARAVRRDLLPEDPFAPAVLRATAALRTCVDADGRVLHACPGPGPLRETDVAKYLDVPDFPPGEPHGTAGLIFGLAGELLLTRPGSDSSTPPPRTSPR